MRGKAERHEAIRRIVEKQTISTHHQLVAELEKSGFAVTQATVSRDIAELGLEKVRRGDRLVYSLPEVERVRRMLLSFVTSIGQAQNLVVIRSQPGTAQGVASTLDGLGWPELMGTVAGDDTILAVGPTQAAAKKFARRLAQLKTEVTQPGT